MNRLVCLILLFTTSYTNSADYVIGVNDSTSGGNIFYSKDDGTTWTQLPGGNLANVTAAYDGIIWGTNSSQQIWYSTNCGLGWHQTNGSLVWLSVSQDNTIWGVNSNQQIWHSTDMGKTWTQTGGRLSNVTVTADGKTVWGTNSNLEIWYSTDMGKNYTQASGRLSNITVTVDGKTVWGTNANQQIWYSTDMGKTWTQTSGRLAQLSVTPDGKTTWGVNSNKQIWYSRDMGKSWTQTKSGLLKQIAVVPNAENFAKRVPDSLVLMGSTAAGTTFVSSNNGSSWQPVNGIFMLVVIMPSSAVYGIDALGQLYVSKNVGKTWSTVLSTNPAKLTFKHIAAGYDETLYGVTNTGKICFTKDSGKNWTVYPDGSYKKVTAGPKGTLVAINDTGTLAFSQNEGTSWTSLTQEALSVAVTSDNVWWITLPNQTIEYSTNNGKTWTQVQGGLTQIATASCERLYGTSKNNQVWWSANSGVNWGQLSGALSQITASRNSKILALLPKDFNVTYATVKQYNKKCSDLTTGITCVKAVGEAAKAYVADKSNKDKQKALLGALTSYCTYRELKPSTPASDILKDLKGFVDNIKQNKQWYADNCVDAGLLAKVFGTTQEGLDAAQGALSTASEATLSGINDTLATAEVAFSAFSGTMSDLGSAAIEQAKNTVNAVANAATSAAKSVAKAFNPSSW